MRKLCALLICLAVHAADPLAQTATVVRIVVRGETNLSTNFVEDFKSESKALGVTVEVVDRRSPHEYTIVLAQESSVAGAAAAVMALDDDQNVVASVVRSGRLSAKGALNACTKELAKKIAILKK